MVVRPPTRADQERSILEQETLVPSATRASHTARRQHSEDIQDGLRKLSSVGFCGRNTTTLTTGISSANRTRLLGATVNAWSGPISRPTLPAMLTSLQTELTQHEVWPPVTAQA